LSLRGGIGLFSGGNPNVWISNAWSNDGITNVQVRDQNFDSSRSVFDGTLALTGARPGYDVPLSAFNTVANSGPANGSIENLVILDPNYEQPSEWKFAIGATYDLPVGGIQMDVDYLHTRANDPAIYEDLSQTQTGTTIIGQPIYGYTNGEDNFMLTNSSASADTDVLSLILKKDFEWGLDLMLGYSYTDAEDVSPMTSSTAGSNFDNLATNDPQNPGAGPSNYFVPHRFTMRAVYTKEFVADLQTRVTVFGFASEGQAQSYVMGSSDLEGNGRFGRHLLYVPTGATDPNVIFEPGFDQAGFFDFVAREGLESGLQNRNENHAKWSYRLDFRIDQELPTFIDGTHGRLFFKMYNLTNFLNDDWGQANDAQFFSVQVVNSTVDGGVNGTGQYKFERFNDRSINDLIENQSYWEARVGLEFEF
jgi:hypothetical protein